MAPKVKKNIGVKAVKSAVSPKGTRTLDFHVGAYNDENEGADVDWGGMAEAEKEQEDLIDEMLQKPKAAAIAASELAEKYGVDFDESDSEDSLLDAEDQNNEPSNPFVERYNSMSKQEIAEENMNLHQEIKEQKQETKKLGVLLEGLEPIPGLDPEKLLDVMEGTEVVDRDYRDAKIVQLAKKVRNLTVSRNAEQARADKWKKQLSSTEAELNKLKEEMDKMASPAARAAALRQQQEMGSPGSQAGSKAKDRDPGQKAAILQHQVDELKRKLYSQGEDLKKTQRALQKELGDGNISMEDALEDGWRGRAQQIIMLKSKIKRLEAGGASGVSRRRRDDVDSRAQEDLQDMEKQRQITMEQLTLDLQSTAEEAEKHKKRFDAAKARTRVLEQENHKLKDSVKVLVNKTDTDNQLVDALRDELKSLQKRVASGGNTLQEAGSRVVRRDDDAMEIASLKATLKRQNEQIERQGQQLQQMRSELHSYKSQALQQDQYNW